MPSLRSVVSTAIIALVLATASGGALAQSKQKRQTSAKPTKPAQQPAEDDTPSLDSSGSSSAANPTTLAEVFDTVRSNRVRWDDEIAISGLKLLGCAQIGYSSSSSGYRYGQYWLDVYEPSTDTKLYSGPGGPLRLQLDYGMDAAQVRRDITDYKNNTVTIVFKVDKDYEFRGGHSNVSAVTGRVTRIDWLDDRGHSLETVALPPR